jgi:2-hydroxyglutarate dehydrogenase
MQSQELTKVHKFSKLVNVPTEFVAINEAAKLEPFVRAKTGILDSPTTGIVDSHHYMQFLLSSFLDSGRGDLALNSTVTKVEPLPSQTPGGSGWELTILDKSTDEPVTITAETIINSAGLAACDISNMILPAPRHVTPYYAKGNYFAYSGSTPSTHRLIYPAPEPGLGGLGTHLTFDISGRIKFGPDVEWIDDPSDVAVSAARLPAAIKEIKKYLPDIDESKLAPDYAGIRPKLGKGASVANVSKDGTTTKGDPSGKGGGIGGDGGKFIDFVIRKEEGFEGFVNLLGIESPGLTSSLAIAERVKRQLYQ